MTDQCVSCGCDIDTIRDEYICINEEDEKICADCMDAGNYPSRLSILKVDSLLSEVENG